YSAARARDQDDLVLQVQECFALRQARQGVQRHARAHTANQSFSSRGLSSKASGVPWNTTLPWPSTHTPVEIFMAMVSFCSTRITDTPRRCISSMASPTTVTILGASPSVGSSIRIRRGLPSRERHMVSICCSPPDRLQIGRAHV